MGEFREHLNLEVNPVSSDRFEILAITAGVANGWEFPAEVLRESLALWEGVNCFVDHSLSARSVRDIAGVLRETRWDEAACGVRAELTAFGPSAKVLAEIGRQVLEVSDEPAVRVGFSADVLFPRMRPARPPAGFRAAPWRGLSEGLPVCMIRT